jgi:hypothetical protein
MSSCKFNYHIITAATVDGLSGVMVSNLFFYICEYSPFFISTLLTELYIKSLYITHSLVNDSIISLRGEVLHHIATLTLPPIIDVRVSSQENEQSCRFV